MKFKRIYFLKNLSRIKKILCYPFKLKYLNQKVLYPTLKKHNFFLVNIEYIYERTSNPTLKKYFFSWEYRMYIYIKGFQISYFSCIYIVNFKIC